MFSILNGNSFKGYDQAGRNEEIKDFAELISGSEYYFGGGKYTVSEIGKSYCDEEWSKKVKSTMADMFNAAGIEVSSAIGGDVLEVCAEVTDHFNAIGAQYSIGDNGALIYGDIDKCWDHNRICCATYTSMVLYKSGLLTAEQINKYNYHWTGDGGVPTMLQAAGWHKVPSSEKQPGDVLNSNGYHVMIYAGNGQVWDQNTCTGEHYTGPFSCDMSGYDVWRAP